MSSVILPGVTQPTRLGRKALQTMWQYGVPDNKTPSEHFSAGDHPAADELAVQFESPAATRSKNQNCDGKICDARDWSISDFNKV
ncbi:MAG: hypothetical protein ACR2OV_11645 [Hyphomicrobiaceae bacterium]